VTVLGGARALPVGARRPRRQAVARSVALPRTATLPRATVPRISARPAAVTQRRGLATARRVAARSHPARPLIGAVLIAFLIGLIYLAQTVHVAATNYEIDQLAGQRDDLYRQVQTVETSVLAWGTEPTVLARAQSLGLDQVPSRVRLSAR
jgi:hypothetical protein